MEIIDFHMHPYLSERDFSGMYGETYFPDSAKMAEDIRRSGITHICGSVIERGADVPGEGFAHIQSLNRRALQLKEELGDYYTPGFHVHPGYVKESCEEIAFMHDKGVRLVGELVPYMHGWKDYSNRDFAEILDTIEQYDMIVSYHTVLDEQEEMEKMIATHPKITFVAAHPGEKEGFIQHIERMKKYKNAYLDISGTGLFRYGMLAYGVKEIGAERILFGTDYPICNPLMYVQAVMQEPVTDRDREYIFNRNARRLLGVIR